MKTSWNDTEKIEAYLLENDPEEKLVFEAQLLLQSGLSETLSWQQLTYALVNSYARRQLRQEIDSVHQSLFTARKHAGFRKRIMAIFKNG